MAKVHDTWRQLWDPRTSMLSYTVQGFDFVLPLDDIVNGD